MRIVTVSDSPTIFSGLARVHRNVIDGLLEAGHEVIPCGWFAYGSDILARMDKGEQPSPVYYKSPYGEVRVLCVPKHKGMNEMYAIYDIVDCVGPDVVVSIGDPWNFFYMQAIRVQASFKFKWIPYLTVESPVGDKWKSLLRYADAVAVASEYGRRQLEGVCAAPRTIEYGADGFFMYDAEKRGELRAERGIGDRVRFLSVGQNTWRKNLPSVLQAIRILRNDPSSRMEMDGKVEFHLRTNVDRMDKQEEYAYDLHKLVRHMDLEEWVTFPDRGICSVFEAPPDEDLRNEYNVSDFVISSSSSEGYGLPIVEGMVCGLPCVGNPSSCVSDHLGAEVGPDGLRERGIAVGTMEQICPPARIANVTDPAGLASGIMRAFRLAGDPDAIEKMKENCVRYGKERSWGKMKKELCDVVEMVAGNTTVVVEEF